MSTTVATDYVGLRKEIRAGYRDLGTVIPDVMKGFGDLHRSAMSDGSLDRATKELIAVAIGIVARCEGCIALHVADALRAGATREQVHEAIGVAILMGGGTASVYATDAPRGTRTVRDLTAAGPSSLATRWR
jgi:AhpD family alkylhydroperoxidase